MAKATEAGGRGASPEHPASDAHIHVAAPGLGLAKLTLGQKLWLVIGLFLALWSGHLILASISGGEVRDMTAVVDAAGRLRMLSQRIALEAQSPDGSMTQRQRLIENTVREARAELDAVHRLGMQLSSQQHQPRLLAQIGELRTGWQRMAREASRVAAGAGAAKLLAASRAALTHAEGLVADIQVAQNERQRILDLLRNGIYLVGALLLVFVGAGVHLWGVRPLRALATMANDLQQGRLQSRVDYPARDEVGQLADTLNHAADRIGDLLASLSAERDELDAQRRRETLLFENGADGLLVVDDAMTIVRANHEAARIFGYPESALVGMDLDVLVPEAQRPGHERLVANYFANPRVRSMRTDMRIRGCRADGSHVPVDIRLSPIELGGRTHAMAAVRDVSTERQAEMVRDRLAGILEVTSDLVLVFREDGALTYANPAAQTALRIAGNHLERYQLRSLLTSKARKRLDSRAIPQASRHGRWLGTLSFEVPPERIMLPVSSVLVCQHGESDGVEAYSLIARDISAEIRHKRELEHQATHDALTGLPNRTVFEDRLSQEIRRADRHGMACAVAFVDVDNFKLVNDSMGHAAGDELLRALSQRLQEVARRVDTVVRFGGDEFALVLPDIGEAADAAAIAERMLDHVARPLTINDRTLALTVSIGVAIYPDHGTDRETLTMRADAAMFRAKESGRNRFAVYHPEPENRVQMNDLDLRGLLPEAMARGELELHYQTLVNASNGAVTGAEALIRWRHKGQLLPPSAFVPGAERQDLIGRLCAWTLEQACHQAQRWLQAGHALDYVAVNISARQIPEDDLTNGVLHALDQSGLPPEKLELELTETAVLEYHEQASVLFNRLRAVGVRLAIDDFGAGYSGLRYLSALPVDKIKLDQSLIAQCEHRHIRILLQSATDMAHQLGATVTAEGIETAEQARMLRMLGCDELQGFRFSRPVPPAEVALGPPPGPDAGPQSAKKAG